MKSMPKIEKYMTPMPHTIGKEIAVQKALELMREYHIRHLPVLDGGKLCGILTDRDIKLANSFRDADRLTCEDVMSPETYVVLPDTPLDSVVKEMAAHKYGSALVQTSNHKIVGIFTTIDALMALDQVLNGNYKASVA